MAWWRLIPTQFRFAIERVEAITDGGSAVYGSDAVGGVINFITRKRFDGIKVGGHFGFADDYRPGTPTLSLARTGATVRPTSPIPMPSTIRFTGSIATMCVTWIGTPPTPRSGWVRTGRATRPTSLSARGNTRRPNFTLATLPNVCDISDEQALYLGGEQHHALASFTQDFNDWLSMDLKAYYTWREDLGSNGPPRAGNVTMRPTNPYYRNLVGTVDAGANQTVNFSYAPVFGERSLSTQNLYSTWNVTPSFTANLGGKGNWQLRTNLNYGESKTEFNNIELFAVGASSGHRWHDHGDGDKPLQYCRDQPRGSRRFSRTTMAWANTHFSMPAWCSTVRCSPCRAAT